MRLEKWISIERNIVLFRVVFEGNIIVLLNS